MYLFTEKLNVQYGTFSYTILDRLLQKANNSF